MLAAEFESRKAPGPQGAPQLLFFVCLFATETAGAGGRIHRNNVDEIFCDGNREMRTKLKAPPLPRPSPPPAAEREKVS